MMNTTTKAAAANDVSINGRASDGRFYGAKYDKSLSRTEIAKRIRADIKAGVAAGELPRAKYSVRTSTYSMGGSIDVSISDVDGLIFLHNVKRLAADHDHPNVFCPINWLSDEAGALLKKVDAIRGAYNHDGSDSQTDYFDVRFYGHAEFDHAYTSTRRAEEIRDMLDERRNEAERAELAADRAAETAAPAAAGNAQADFLAHCGVTL